MDSVHLTIESIFTFLSSPRTQILEQLDEHRIDYFRFPDDDDTVAYDNRAFNVREEIAKRLLQKRISAHFCF